jgi:hypothetical protein
MLMLTFADGQDSLEAASVRLDRSLGSSATWTSLHFGLRETRGDERLDRLADALTAGPVDVTPTWDGPGGGALGPPGRVVSARWRTGGLEGYRADLEYLEIVSQITLPKTDRNPFLPRWRVHRQRDLKAVLDVFSDLVTPTRAVQKVLSEITHPDADKASIIQAGESDWCFVQLLLRQAPTVAGFPSWDPLTFVGGMDPDLGTEGKWVVTPGGRRAYEEWGDVENRKLAEPPAQNRRRQLGSMPHGVRVPEFPDGMLPSSGYAMRGMKFDASKWKAWARRDLPLFDWNDHFIVRASDTAYAAGGRDELLWSSDLWGIPPEGAIPLALDRNSPERAQPHFLRPWFGRASVKTYSDSGPWIEAKLRGFEDGADVAHVRLTTPYSGLDGETGFHTVPEKDSELVVGWSGSLIESVLLGENVRLAAAKFVSPSLWLDKDWKGRFEKLDISEIGRVKVDSDYSMELTKRTSLRGQREMQLNGDGAEVRMRGGVVRTGRSG